MYNTPSIARESGTTIMSKRAERPFQNHRVYLVLLSAMLAIGSTTTGGAADASKMDSFAKCLADRKTTMYGSFLCPHCDDQKKLFGGSLNMFRTWNAPLLEAGN